MCAHVDAPTSVVKIFWEDFFYMKNQLRCIWMHFSLLLPLKETDLLQQQKNKPHYDCLAECLAVQVHGFTVI